MFPTASGKPADNIKFRFAIEFRPEYLFRWLRCGNCVDIWFYPFHFCYHWNDPEQ